MRPTCVGQMKIAAPVGGEDRERAEESLSEIDVIAPIKILQQILKTPHSKSRVSIAVQRSGYTVVLNPGPGVQESEKLIGKRKNVLGVSFQNYAEASLGLSPVRQQVSTLSWLKAWLDNVMASVPELAICNHLNGVVQGYELLPDGISGVVDPNVVQQNCLAVLRFLQSNCKEDPGVYWLYKAAGEDVIQLFDLSTISKNHSSSASSFPLVVRACAHEQFARFILNNEEEFDLTAEANNVQRKFKVADLEEESLDRVMNSTSGSSHGIGPDRAPLTTAISVSLQRAAVHHVIQAIKSLMVTRQLISSEEEVEWLPTSSLDRKLWSLVMLLGESYLSLGEAYLEDGQLPQALNIVELACSIFGSMPYKFEERLFASALYTSFSRLTTFKTPGLSTTQGELVNEPVLSTTQEFTSFREVSSVRIFWATVWLIVGEIHVSLFENKLKKKYIPEGSEVAKKEEMPSEIVEEVEKLKKKLTAHSKKCNLCLLVNCTCGSQSKKSRGRGKPGSSGIFKFLTTSRKDDPESHLLAALECYQQTQRALFPSDGKDLQSLSKKKALVWNEIGQYLNDIKKYAEAEKAMTNSIEGFKEIGEYEGVICTIVNLGFIRQEQAGEKKSTLAQLQEQLVQEQLATRIGLTRGKDKGIRQRTAEKAYKEALEATTLDYVTSLGYFLTAERELGLSTEKGIPISEEMRTQVYIQLGHAYRILGVHLEAAGTTAVAPHVLESNSYSSYDSSPGRLSDISAFRGARDSFKILGEVGKALYASTSKELASCHHKYCLEFLESMDIEKAKEHALLADENYQRSVDGVGPENNPAEFLEILFEDSDMSFQFKEQSNFFQMLELDLSRFLEGRHISKEDEKELKEELLLKFWARLRNTLRILLTEYSKSSAGGANKSGTLKEMYSASLKATSLSDLNGMHALWTARS
ncbi:hypothetical protein CARUB_v10008236mg [Capsella rubella]|uniref:EDRF1 N-terminal domain-containing protein n=1 Tax=Capsella rubella TaxID=81985 RepID=R0IB06_9BRAS|nr:hypothetical protein CARUB_v10008236mg [Capsella rubella]